MTKANYLTDVELSQMRDDIQYLALPYKGNVLTVTYTYDGQGGVTPSWGTAVTDVAYRLDLKQSSEQVQGGGMQPYSYWQLTLPYGTDIDTDARFEDADGNQYSITGIDTSRSYSLCLELIVEAV